MRAGGLDHARVLTVDPVVEALSIEIAAVGRGAPGVRPRNAHVTPPDGHTRPGDETLCYAQHEAGAVAARVWSAGRVQ
jgi:hypothetical protein